MIDYMTVTSAVTIYQILMDPEFHRHTVRYRQASGANNVSLSTSREGDRFYVHVKQHIDGENDSYSIQHYKVGTNPTDRKVKVVKFENDIVNRPTHWRDVEGEFQTSLNKILAETRWIPG